MSKEEKELKFAAVRASGKLSAVSALISDMIKECPKLEKKLKYYGDETAKARRVIDLVHIQKALQTLGGVASIRQLHSIGDDIEENLPTLEDNDTQVVDTAVGRLTAVRKDLVLQVRLASVGLDQSGDTYTVDTKLVEKTNEAIRKVLTKGPGLDITAFVANLGRKPDENGKIHLSAGEYDQWSQRQLDIAYPETKELPADAKTRIMSNCLSRDQSIQILGPVGVDMWKNIRFIKSEGLVATDQSIQIAYATTLEVLKLTCEMQGRWASAKRD